MEEETYSDSDDFSYDFDGDWKAEFAIENQVFAYGRCRSCGPAFVDAGCLVASAWLLRLNGCMVRVMRRVTPELDDPTEGSVTWAGSRRFLFADGPKPNEALCLHLAGWLIQESTGYRWGPEHGDRPPQSDPKLLSRLCVRWEKAGGTS